MLGLIVLFVIGVYLAVSALVVWLAARWAKKRGRRGWVWGGVAAFAMYNLVFWDLIPTLVMHKYYCATEAGFWVYKTPEQWVRENPGGLETLAAYDDGRLHNLASNHTVYPLNRRISWHHEVSSTFNLVGKYEDSLVDEKKSRNLGEEDLLSIWSLLWHTE